MSVGLPLNWIQFVLYVSHNSDYGEDMAWYDWQAFFSRSHRVAGR
jgi:hypothetical protein